METPRALFTPSLSKRAVLGAAIGAPFVLGNAVNGQTPSRATSPGASRAWRRSPRLKAGDVIGLVSPSSANEEADDRDYADENIRALGFVPKHGRHTMDRFGYLAGQDQNRAADINSMFADPQVKAIICMRGGWGAARLLPYLNYEMIAANPKPVLGLSDVTALHLALQARAGLVSFHGQMAASGWGPVTVASFKELLMEAATPTWAIPKGSEPRLVQRRGRSVAINRGKAQGTLIGGNLTVLAALIGTPYLPDLRGAILMLEDIDEAEYRIDRMLTQLGQAGHLAGLKGFVFGQCTNCKGGDASYGGFPLSEVLQQHIKPLGIPAFHGAAFGHIGDQAFLPLGCTVELDADARTIRLLEPAVL